MYTISQRREAVHRIADPADIPAYRRLLLQAGSPFSSHRDPNPRKLAAFLVSALLDHMSEDDIVRGVKGAPAPDKAAPAADVETPAETPGPAVKKNSGRTRSIRASIGRIWTTLSSGRRTRSSRTPSISDGGSGETSAGSTSRR